MRFAVCFSLPVATLPDNSTAESVTFTTTLELASVGSFFKAASICVCRLLDSALAPALAPVSLCGMPELWGKEDPELALPPAVVPALEVDPVLPTPVEGVLEELVLPCIEPVEELLVPVLLLVDGVVAAGGVLALELPDCGAVLLEELLEEGEVDELVEPAVLPVLELGAVELLELD